MKERETDTSRRELSYYITWRAKLIRKYIARVRKELGRLPNFNWETSIDDIQADGRYLTESTPHGDGININLHVNAIDKLINRVALFVPEKENTSFRNNISAWLNPNGPVINAHETRSEKTWLYDKFITDLYNLPPYLSAGVNKETRYNLRRKYK